MADLGSDVNTPFGADGIDVDPAFGEVSGNLALAQSLARGLETEPGSLWWAPDEGFNLRAQLHEAHDAGALARIEAAVAAQCERDERVRAAEADAAYDRATQALTVKVRVVTDDGPFAFVLAVSAVTVELLSFAEG